MLILILLATKYISNILILKQKNPESPKLISNVKNSQNKQ